MDGQSSGVLYSAIFNVAICGVLNHCSLFSTALPIHSHSLQLDSPLNFERFSYICKWYFHLAGLLIFLTSLPKIVSSTHLSYSLHTLNFNITNGYNPSKMPISHIHPQVDTQWCRPIIFYFHCPLTFPLAYFILSVLTCNTSSLILSLSWWPCFLFQWENCSNQ